MTSACRHRPMWGRALILSRKYAKNQSQTHQPPSMAMSITRETFIHGLLECESTQCKSECDGQTKKWNRDVLAVCNFRRIWHAYIQGRQRPDDLTRRGGNRDRDSYGGVVGNGNPQQ